MNQNLGREFDWDDTIEKDPQGFILLPEGDYDFEVVEFERGRHAGSEKLPPCNKAIISLKFTTDDGIQIIKHNLFLHSITEGMLCAFFTAIGQRKKGERLQMNWSKVIGAKGRAKVGIQKWTTKKGEEIDMNEIKRFYDPVEQPSQQTGFQPGKF